MGGGVAIVPDERYCTYSSVKLDSDLLMTAKAAAAKSGKSFQEWLSDLVNEAAAKVFKEKPIKRLPPPPRKRRDEV